MSVELYRESPGNFDSRTLNRKLSIGGLGIQGFSGAPILRGPLVINFIYPCLVVLCAKTLLNMG